MFAFIGAALHSWRTRKPSQSEDEATGTALAALNMKTIEDVRLLAQFMGRPPFDIASDGSLTLSHHHGLRRRDLYAPQDEDDTPLPYAARHPEGQRLLALRALANGALFVAQVGKDRYGLNQVLYVGTPGMPLHTYQGLNPSALAFSPGGQWLAVGDESGNLYLIDWRHEEIYPRYHAHGGAITHLVFSADGQRIATGGRGGGVRLWSCPGLETRAQIDTLSPRLQALALDHDGQRVLFGGGHLLQWWDTSSGVVIFQQAMEAAIAALAISPDGALLAVGDDSGRVSFLDSARGERCMQVDTGQIGVEALAFCPQNRALVVADEAGFVQEWGVWAAKHGAP